MRRLSRERWQEIEPLVDRSLEMSVASRSAWLRELRQGSPELAAQLEALLADDGAEPESDLLAEFQDVSLAGLALGAYRLERPLGQGGMGAVWLARRRDGRFDGLAAIKLLHMTAVDSAAHARFRHEGSALARLTHPGIAKLFDAGVSGSGQPYLVLEYVDGVTIDKYVAAAKLSQTGIIRLFLQVLSAVEHAHVNLVVHRDIKPSNILVTGAGVAKLLDFGIAKLLDADGQSALKTSANGALFTPYYAAPEQVRGEALTTTTDVYALGVLLYELLSGRHPTCEGATTPIACVRAMLENEPARLGPRDLDSILNKALRKSPSERYQSVAEFADDLERYLLHEPVRARAPTTWYRANRFVRRNRLSVLVGLVTMLGLIAATGASLVKMREAAEQRDLALRERARADAQVEFQRILLSTAGDETYPMRKLLDASRAVIEQQRIDEHAVRTRLFLQLAAGYAEFYELGLQRQLLERAEALALAGDGIELLPEIRCNLADNLRLQGEYAAAWKALDAVEPLLVDGVDPTQRAVCLVRRAVLGTETSRSDESVVAAERALQLLQRVHQTHTLLYFEARTALAESLSSSKQSRAAVQAYERAIADMNASGLGASSLCLSLRQDLAVEFGILGLTQRALPLLRAAVEQAARLNPAGKLNWQPAIHYAEVALYQADLESALQYFTIIVDQALREENLFWEGRGLYGRIRVYIQTGQLAEARRDATRLAVITASYPHVRDTDDVIPDMDVVEGLFARKSGDAAQAYGRFLSALRTGGYYEHKRLKRLRPVALLAADAALATGKLDDAFGLAHEAFEIAHVDDSAETQSAFVGEARLMEGRVWLARGDTRAARATLEQAVIALRNGAGASDGRTREAERLLAKL